MTAYGTAAALLGNRNGDAAMLGTFFVLLLTVWFNGVPASCMVDTGSPVTVLAQSQAARVVGLEALEKTLSVQGVGGAPYEAKVGRVAAANTQDLAWRQAEVVILPDQMLPGRQCLLGMDLLGQQPVVFDWTGKRVLPYAAGRTVVAALAVQDAPEVVDEGVDDDAG